MDYVEVTVDGRRARLSVTNMKRPELIISLACANKHATLEDKSSAEQT